MKIIGRQRFRNMGWKVCGRALREGYREEDRRERRIARELEGKKESGRRGFSGLRARGGDIFAYLEAWE
ncbi:MAG TPA: hypothetical protein PLQ35_01490 [bacterium]|nr:hypothetical protein [bacterium]HQL60945.1 hypothetical protein [bacterium]